MASVKKIGFYWGDRQITILDVEKNNILQRIDLPLGDRSSFSDFSFNIDIAEEIRIVALIQKALRDYNIQTKDVHVSISMKDIILRSFVIPFVNAAEMRSVIEFEAKKYIPFDVKDVVFVFNVVPFTEDKIKRLRVYFFAIRREAWDRYERIFQQAGLSVVYAEPAVVSLMKSMLLKKEVSLNERFVFLHLEEEEGWICFFDKGTPQFIHDFHLSRDVDSNILQSIPSPELLRVRTMNEIRNTFDFYVRQFGFDGNKSIRLFSMTSANEEANVMALAADLKLDHLKFKPSVLGMTDQVVSMDVMYALGSCLETNKNLPELNFSQKKVGSFSGITVQDLVPFFITAAVCACVVGLGFFGKEFKIKQFHEQEQSLLAQQGEFANSPEESITAKIEENKIKLTAYKNIRTRSQMYSVLVIIASLIPDDVILSNLNLRYVSETEHSMNLDLSGYAYNLDKIQQIHVVDEFILALKNDKRLKKYFSKVGLVSFQKATATGKATTTFSIRCL